MQDETAVTNPILRLLSQVQLRRLICNRADEDSEPVALLRCSCGEFYLLGAIDPAEPDVAYCLYEDSEGVPTLDTVSFDCMWESSEGTGHVFAPVPGFFPTATIGEYFEKAQQIDSVSAVFASP